MLLVPILLSALAVAPGIQARQAAVLQLRGELVAARARIDAALAEGPDDVAALFVAACIAIESGRLDDASTYASRLARRSPAPPQATVVKALVQRRREHPGEPLREAVAEAWRVAGRPDLSGGLPGLERLRESSELVPQLARERLPALGPGEKLLFDRPPDEVDRLRAVFAAARRPERNPLVVNLELLGELAYLAPNAGSDATRATEAAARVGQVVTAADPGNGYLRIAWWLAAAPETQPLSEADLDLLEREAARPRFGYPRREMLGQLRVMAHRVDPDHADMRATLAALGAPVAMFVLWKRAEVTRRDGASGVRTSARAAGALAAVGRRLGESRAILDRMVGAKLERTGALLGGDAEAIAATNARTDALAAWREEAVAAEERLGLWPFASSWREWDPDEVSYFQRLLD
ncbi:MAG TPA: hypothetical protein VLS93_13880 [Anaeromyxobacteraceae bacterium]|nr:hypothetical protein [Anaeromyxobacteraceae bacterium]